MHCVKCGSSYEFDDSFCPQCGVPVSARTTSLPPQQQPMIPYSQTQAQPQYAQSADTSIPNELYAYQPLMWATVAFTVFSLIMSRTGNGESSVAIIMSAIGTVVAAGLSHSNIKSIAPYLDSSDAEKADKFIAYLWSAVAGVLFYTVVPFGPDVTGGLIHYDSRNAMKYGLGLLAVGIFSLWLTFYRDRVIAGRYFAFSPVARVELSAFVVSFVNGLLSN
jgi:hypothetical protein